MSCESKRILSAKGDFLSKRCSKVRREKMHLCSLVVSPLKVEPKHLNNRFQVNGDTEIEPENMIEIIQIERKRYP